jgi:hypothetical protein
MKKSIVFFLILLIAASTHAQNVLYSNNFENGAGSATIIGNGQIVSESAPFGQVFHNAAGGQGIRSNYLKLPTNIFANLQSSGSKELTIAFWVNKGTAVNYYWTPIFTAYGAAPNPTNIWPMLALQSRLLAQVNCAGWSDFTGAQNVLGSNKESTIWLDDNAWHYYTAVFTETNVKIYVDGVIQNEWNLNGNSDGGSVSGLFNNGSELTYIALGGNQAWDWADPDPAYKFDDLVIYSTALTVGQINENRAAKYLLNVSTNANTSAMSNCADCDVVVGNGALLNVDASRTYKSLTVKPGAKITFQSSYSITGTMTLESDISGNATVIETHSNPVTQATVQQYTQAGRNWYISSPVSNAPYSIVNRGSYVSEFNESSKSWVTVNNGNLVQGKGYVQVAASDQGSTGVVSFTGTINSGNVVANLTRTGTTQAGFNLVGNPYPSYLDWSLVAQANPNVLPTMWFRTKKTAEAGGGYAFATVNVAVPSTPIVVANDANTTVTKLIPPMQAYWVRLIENAGTNVFTVTNNMRSHADNSGNKFKVSKQTSTPIIRLQLTDGTQRDETVLFFDENASDAPDRFDSPKIGSNDINSTSIYTYAGNERLVINGLNSGFDNKSVSLAFDAPVNKLLSLIVSEMSGLDNIDVILEDRTDGSKRKLNKNMQYDFVNTGGETGSRFNLRFNLPGITSSINETDNHAFRVYSPSKGRLVIESGAGSVYSIYNVMGQKLIEGKAESSVTELDLTELNAINSGILIVSIHQDKFKHISRILL